MISMRGRAQRPEVRRREVRRTRGVRLTTTVRLCFRLTAKVPPFVPTRDQAEATVARAAGYCLKRGVGPTH